MFDFLFGWRKASRCQKLIRLVQCRLKLLKNNKSCVVRKLREDIAELLKDDNQEAALERDGQLISEESLVAAYELLDYFCEFITIKFSYIRTHRDCPDDINEEFSSLIFASLRCVDLLELGAILKLFEGRYGSRFVMSAMNLRPGNLVNSQVIEKLSRNLVSDDMKHRVVHEIVSSNNLTLEYSSKLQQQQMSRQCDSYLDSGISTSTSSSSVVLPSFQRKACPLMQEKKRVDGKSSTESSFQFTKDGVQEFQSHTNESSQRFFMFSWVPVTKGETCREADEYNPWKTKKDIDQYEEYYDDGPLDSSQDDRHGFHHHLTWPRSRGSSHSPESAASYSSLKPPCYCSALSVEQPPQNRSKKTEEPQAPDDHQRATAMAIEIRAQATSFPPEHPNHLTHVHPKLPDYDDLAAKFTALKKAYWANKATYSQLALEPI